VIGGAGEQAGDAPAGAADVEHRQADQVGHAGAEQPGRGPQRQQRAEVGVGQLRALRQAGGATGVELNGGVGRLGRQVRVGRRLAVAPRLERFRFGMAAEGHDFSHCLEFAADLLDHREVVLADEQDLGLGVVDDVQHLGRGEPPVDRHDHRVGLGDAEQQLEEEVVRLVEMGDAGLRPDAVGDQRIGDLAGGPVERGVGGGAALVDDGRHVRLAGRVAAHDIGKPRDFDGHPVSFP
jgi:hypothetical protein